ncbi:MAG: pyruvate dehydrogenase [Chloroflexi bacterium RBG_16_50_9]|nr:MAG: pyruvate dehydrogenase [Chloroflexi bacterium RBG_16_50_9]
MSVPTGEKLREITYREAIQEALVEAMEANPHVFLMGEDIGKYGGAFGVTAGLLDKFGPDRVRDTPMSEAAITGVATGASLLGMRPVIEIMFMDFITLAMDQLVNHATKFPFIFGEQSQVPLVLRTPCGGWRGYGPTHSQSLEAWFLHVPGLNVLMPSTPYDAKGLLKEALYRDEPTLFIEHKLLYGTRGQVPEHEYTVPFGSSIVARTGKDVTVVAYSYLLTKALAVAEELHREGVEVEVIDPRTLAPLGIDTIVSSVKKTGRAVLVEEGTRTGGVSAEIGFQIMEHAYEYLDAPIIRVAADDIPVPCNRSSEDEMLPKNADIKDAIMKVLG